MGIETAALGKNIIWKTRQKKKEADVSATRLALQIDGNLSGSGSSNRKVTKDGAIVSRGQNEWTADLTYVASQDEVNNELFESFDRVELQEFWRIDLSTLTDDLKADAMYMYGYLESWELPDNVDDTVDSSTTLAIQGKPVKGQVQMTQEELELIEEVIRFRDTDPINPADEV